MILLLANLAPSLFMTGLIWFVQVVHYPLFGAVGRGEFAEYEKRHTALTAFVVGPPMLVELGAAVALVFYRRASASAWLGLALVGIVWVSTAAFQIPCHGRLESGFDAATHRRLVWTNWIRTSAWTLKSALAICMVAAR